MNANLRMMGGVLRHLKHINDEDKRKEEWELRTKTGIINRILDINIRLKGMAWRNAAEYTRLMIEKEEKEYRLKRKTCMMLVHQNFSIAVACFNTLKANNNLGQLDDEKEKMIGDMRNGLLDGMVKTKERWNREMQLIAFKKLVAANEKVKRMTKSIVLFINKNGERQLSSGLNKLIENKKERDAYFNDYMPRMTKILMKFMKESATFMLSAGLKGL